MEKTMQADASFTVGNRVFHVVCEVLSVKAFSGKVHGMMVSPTALLVEEEERLYSISLTGGELDVEEILRIVPSLKEKVRKVWRTP
jgi:uncharacterized spore protein YtfJ